MMQMDEVLGKVQKNILNIAIMGVMVVLAYKIFAAQQKQVEAIKAQTEMESQKSAVLTQISQSEKKFKNLRRLINNKDEAALLPTLNAIARDHQVKINVIKPLPPEQRVAGYTTYPFAMSIAADNYHAFGKFVSALESHPFMFSIDSMSVHPDPSRESRRYKLQAELEVSSILLRD